MRRCWIRSVQTDDVSIETLNGSPLPLDRALTGGPSAIEPRSRRDRGILGRGFPPGNWRVGSEPALTLVALTRAAIVLVHDSRV